MLKKLIKKYSPTKIFKNYFSTTFILNYKYKSTNKFVSKIKVEKKKIFN